MNDTLKKFNFSKTFINRPRLAGVIAVVIALGGAISIFQLPIAQYPQVTPPQIVVSAAYPGANAAVLADTVGAPIEDAVNGVDDMLYMSSSSDSSGAYSLTITFAVGIDPDIAQVKVQNRVQRAQPLLPAEVIQQGVRVEAQSADILGFIMMVSPEKSRDELFMSEHAYKRVKPVLERLRGISAADLFSAKYSMRIWLDSDRIAALGLSVDEVVNAIRQQNVQASLGAVGGVPGDGSAQMVYTLQAKGRLDDVEEFANIIVRTGANGAVLRLRDVARVELGADSYLTSATYNGMPAVGMRLTRKPGTNALKTIDQVRAELVRMNAEMPADMQILLAYDATNFVRKSIKEIAITLIITIMLTIFVCYLFLQDWRATLVPAITIPVSLLGTFGILMMLGFSINTLTLFALILAIGVVVDDAIVVVERVLHLMETEGLDHRTAAFRAMEDVSMAVIATTLVLLSIFVPVGFIGGITGKIYQQFAVTISAAVVLSSVTALTLSPALCAIMLRIPKKRKHGPLCWFNTLLTRTRGRYVGAAGWLSRRSLLTIFCLFVAFAGIGFTFVLSPTSFLPDEDQGVIFGAMQLPEGATVARTTALLDEVTELLQNDPDIEFSLGVTGFSFIGLGENVGLLVIGLKDWDERKDAAQSVVAVQQRLGAQLGALSDAQIHLFVPPAIMGLGASGGLDFQLQAVGDNDPQKLEAALQGFLMQLNISPEIMMAFSGYSAQTPNLFIDVDRTKAEMLKVPVSKIFSTLQNYLGSRYINDVNLNGQVNKVIVQADWLHRKNPEDINSIFVKSLDGNMVPLKSLVKIETILAPRAISRYNKFSSAGITAITMPWVSSGDAMEKVEQLAAEHLGEEYAYEWSGLSYQEKKTSGQSSLLILLALVFGYLFLVAQFESWTVPLAVMMSISIAILGALLGMYTLHMPLSIYAQLGLILLVGLASKNAILIVEFSKTQQERGMGVVEAAVDGAGQRFRAVLMTAFTFILGVLPMVFATGAGAASRRSIGTTVFWGMVAATLVGIILVPALYTLFQTMRMRAYAARTGRAAAPLLLLALLLPLLNGCVSVGPNYEEPDEHELPGTVSNTVATAEWWGQFGDPVLSRYVEAALAENLDLDAAAARIQQARAQMGIVRAQLGPAFNASAGVNEFKSPDYLASEDGTLYRAGFDAVWEIDLFGGNRRALEAARASLEGVEASYGAVKVTVAAETAAAYIALRTFQRRLEIAHGNLTAQQQTLEILESRMEVGLSDELAVQQARYNVKGTHATIPSLEAGLSSSQTALAVLIGTMPGDGPAPETAPIPQAAVLQEGMLGIPADLLRRRPDVRQAERELAAQTARIGESTADLYPKFALKGSIGVESLSASTLFKSGSDFYSIIPGVQWAIFHSGSIRNNIKVQEALQEERLAGYEQTVIRAVKEVKDALMDYRKENERYDHLVGAVEAAQAAADVAQNQYTHGLTDFNNVLDAQRSLLAFQEQMINSEGIVSLNSVRLYKALGGGW